MQMRAPPLRFIGRITRIGLSDHPNDRETKVAALRAVGGRYRRADQLQELRRASFFQIVRSPHGSQGIEARALVHLLYGRLV